MYTIRIIDSGTTAIGVRLSRALERIARMRIELEDDIERAIRKAEELRILREASEPYVMQVMVPPRLMHSVYEIFRRARSALPMRWGTYQGAF